MAGLTAANITAWCTGHKAPEKAIADLPKLDKPRYPKPDYDESQRRPSTKRKLLIMASENCNSLERENYIRNLVLSEFGRQVVSLERLTGGRNTFVYHLTLAAADEGQENKQRAQPGVVAALPRTTAETVLRLSNPASGLNENIRVQNEAAVMSLTREALAPLDPSIAPQLYGWASGETGKGWTLCEYMPGENLQDKFGLLGDDAKRNIVIQIAQIFKCIQRYRLPGSIRGYGGIGYAEDGSIVTGPTVIAGGGPCETHSELYIEYLQTQRTLSGQCDVVQGWKGTDLPGRIERLAKEKFVGICEWEEDLRPTLVHGDFDIHNILFNPETNRITALLDYDFGHIGSQADEYMYSFAQLGYLALPVIKGHDDLMLLRKSVFGGFDHDKLADKPKRDVDWKLALMVDGEFAKAGVERPQDIPSMEEIATRYWTIQGVSPPIFFLERIRAAGSEKLQKMKEREQEQLDINLQALGY